MTDGTDDSEDDTVGEYEPADTDDDGCREGREDSRYAPKEQRQIDGFGRFSYDPETLLDENGEGDAEKTAEANRVRERRREMSPEQRKSLHHAQKADFKEYILRKRAAAKADYPTKDYTKSRLSKSDNVPDVDMKQSADWLAEARGTNDADENRTDEPPADKGRPNDKDEADPETADYLGPQALYDKPQGRENMMLSDDRYMAAQTARGFACNIASPKHWGKQTVTGNDVLKRFKQWLSDDVLPASCADVVAEEIVCRFGDNLSEESQQRLRATGEKAVLSAAHHADDGREDDPYHRQFEGANLHTVEYMHLSHPERREYIREKARRIRNDRPDR